MSDHRSRPPLVIRPTPSWRITGFLLATHLVAAAVAIVLPVAWPLRAGLVLLIMASLIWLLWSQVLARAPWSIREAIWDEHGWRLSLADGRVHEARLAPATYVGVGLLILNFRIGRFGRRALVLTNDSIDPDILRRLRVRLRLTASMDPTLTDKGP